MNYAEHMPFIYHDFFSGFNWVRSRRSEMWVAVAYTRNVKDLRISTTETDKSILRISAQDHSSYKRHTDHNHIHIVRSL